MPPLNADGKPGGPEGERSLRRDLRLVDAVAIGLGAIVGAGIFVVLGIAAGVAGPALLVGLLLAGVAATCNALSSAQLAAVYPQSGGTYEYGYRLLHPLLGFAAGWMFLASKLSAGGTVALGFGGYAARLLPGVPPRAAAVMAVVVLTAANYFGVRKAGRLNTVIVSCTLLVLIAFVLSGLPAFDPGNLQPFAPTGVPGILQAAALLFFAYTGYARLATLGEEVHDPERTIPRAIGLTVAVALVLYAAVAIVAVGAVGAPALAETAAPLERAARDFPLQLVRLLVVIGAATAMLGVLLSQILGISRMLLAMARRRDLPAPLAHVSPAHHVPDRGVFLTGLLIAALALFGTIEWVAAAAAFTILLYYGITNAAALRLPPDQRLFPTWVAWLGLLFCAVLALSLQWQVIIAGLAVLALGFLWRWIYGRAAGGRPGE
jgi:basic amino acid/polyamine antiporter, APA family